MEKLAERLRRRVVAPIRQVQLLYFSPNLRIKKNKGKMMSVDKRSVTTDALATLGTIIDDTAKRDAIHIAVEPTIATQDLMPGQHVGVDGSVHDPVGIVDPFLTQKVLRGERFWLLVYPRQIDSLRHVWSHSAFKEEENNYTKEEQTKITKVLNALDGYWVHDFAKKIGKSYEKLMASADYYVAIGEDIQDNSEGYKAAENTDEWTKFWDYYEEVRGIKVERKDNFFYCSC